MSLKTKTIKLENEKKLILFINEEDRVFRVDIFFGDNFSETYHKPYGISVEQIIQEYG